MKAFMYNTETPDRCVEQTTSTLKPLVGLALSMLLSSLGVSIVNVALPTLAHEFATSFQSVQWVIISYLLSTTIVIVSAGRVGDQRGHRRVLLAGITLFTAASILCGIAPTLSVLITARVVQGVGAAMMMALTVALVSEIVPKERTGSAMGLLGTMSALGTALGPSLGGVLIIVFGWRAIFLILALIGILSFILVHRFLRVDRPKGEIVRTDIDSIGTLLLGLSLLVYALAVTVGSDNFDLVNVSLLMAAVLAIGLFVLVESRVPSPLINLSVFRNLAFSASLISNALVATVMMATLVVGPFYLFLGLGLNQALVGFVMSIGPIISTLSGVPAGRIVDRQGATCGIITGLIAMAAGSVALTMLPVSFGLTGYIAGIAILTPGYQLFQAANNTAVMTDVPQDERGTISGILSLSRNIGLITGASVMGAVFTVASATTDIMTASPESVATGMKVTFLIASGLIVVSLGMTILVRGFTKTIREA